MIKRIINSGLPLIVYNPSKVFDLDYFRHIYDAGGLPVFDTEFFSAGEIISFIKKMHDESFLFGIRIFCRDSVVLNYLNENNIENLDLVVLAYTGKDELNNIGLSNTFYKVFIEVVDINISEKLSAFQPHGLIVKGNEASGKVSKHTSFMLMQWYLEKTEFPVFIHGGVGMHTAAGMFAAGVCGIVLDDQLYLTKEAPLSAGFRTMISSLEERDTIILGENLPERYRVFSKPGTVIVQKIKEHEMDCVLNNLQDEVYKLIGENITGVDCEEAHPMQGLFYLGQDAIFAGHFIKDSAKLKDVIYKLFRNIGEYLEAVDEFDPLVAGSPLAKTHHTKYPVIQGPMANISDNAEFASQVYEKGGLPFLALGNLPAEVAEEILKSCGKKLQHFGAGIIGLDSVEGVFQKHADLLKKYKVKYAVIGGGKPAQAIQLEENGILAYLHTPSLNALKNAFSRNIKRIILEGNEAGGHIGALTSFILWEIGIELIHNNRHQDFENFTILFAGGIAGTSASHFISGMASHLSKRKVKIGILAATPYLFTNEITESGALKKLYRDKILGNKETCLIGSSVNLHTKTLVTPFSIRINQNELYLINEGLSLEERKKKFEKENFGAHLIAAKAKSIRDKDDKGNFSFQAYGDEEQYNKGNFISGDAIVLFNKETGIEDLHNKYFLFKEGLFGNLNKLESFSHEDCCINDEIAIIGMGGIFPDAGNLDQFWGNIISKKYSIGEVPKDRLDTDLFCDSRRDAEDKSYSRHAGVIKDFVFDAQKIGLSDNEADKMTRSLKILMESAFMALRDAGYLSDKHLPEDRTMVVTANCLNTEFHDRHHRLFFPELKNYLSQTSEIKKLNDQTRDIFFEQLKKAFCDAYPCRKLEDTLLNTEASAIARKFGFSGVSYSVDAACATSFIAIDCAVKSLLAGEYDCALVGGVNANLSPEIFVGFSKIGGLSDNGSFPFDERANGFIIGEGGGVVILKRMKDAIRDKDHIHGIIKGIGTSSDGKGKAIAAPNIEGQALAVKRCFSGIKTNFSIGRIDYIEAHGTSTTVGDATETNTLNREYKCSQPVGISSIKSQIGHLMGGAGMAGLLKVLLAIKNKTLPPNGQFRQLSSKIRIDAPLYIIEEASEWKKENNLPRAAAVSSFGFGGINTHIAVEEYTLSYLPLERNIFKNPDYDFNDKRIVIAGAGCLLPGAKNIEEYWSVLNSDIPFLKSVPGKRFHVGMYAAEKDKEFHFPASAVGLVDFDFNNVRRRIPPNAFLSIDKNQLFALESASQAIDNSNLKNKFSPGNRIAVIIGNSLHGENLYRTVIRTRMPLIDKMISNINGVGHNILQDVSAELHSLINQDFLTTTEDTLVGYLANITSGRIANHFNCNGANYIVDAASASSAIAVSNAIRGLKNNDYEFVITGGSDSNLTPSIMNGFKSWGLLSNSEGIPYHDKADGVNLSEGAVVFVMTTLKTAVENKMKILAELHDFSVSMNPEALLISPDKSAFQKCISQYYKNSAILPKEIKSIEVCGTSNILYDLMEYQIINKKFHGSKYWGNIKPSSGYLKSANPAAEMLKMILMNHHKSIPSNNVLYNNKTIIDAESALKNNIDPVLLSDGENRFFAADFFGVGGNHVHAVISSLPLWLEGERKTITAVKTTVQSPVTINAAGKSLSAVLLSGQGAQYKGMMHELYRSDEIIRQTIDKGDAVFRSMKGYSIAEIMFGDEEQLILTNNTQPAVFLSSAALFNYLSEHSFKPDYFIGHSLGEFTALYCSGMIGFEETLKLIIRRADLMKEAALTHPGLMVAVLKSESETQKYLSDSGIRSICIANKNCDNQTVVSGEEKGIGDFISYLKSIQVPHSKVNVRTAFHTPFFKEASDKFREYLGSVSFNLENAGRVFSNVTGQVYPPDANEIKNLLAKQMYSPVEFVRILTNASAMGVEKYVEAGPGRILTTLTKNTSVKRSFCENCIGKKNPEKESLAELIEKMCKETLIERTNVTIDVREVDMSRENTLKNMNNNIPESDKEEFDHFVSRNSEFIDQMAYNEFLKRRLQQEREDINKLGLYAGNIVISGVSIGLPGTNRKVFDESNFDNILSGMNFIESLPEQEKIKMLDKNITRLDKDSDGNARFKEINGTDEVIQLAGRLGYFNSKEYGIEYEYDAAYNLAIAAGIEALKDAKIPLVKQYKKTTTGTLIEEGYGLPDEMQDKTGVIFSSVFTGAGSLIDEITRYYQYKFLTKPYQEFENIYYYLMEKIQDKEVKDTITNWFFNIKNQSLGCKPYEFKKNLLLDLANIGSAVFAQHIKARGANVHISAACASTTHAVGIAEDWIRTGRCERVIVIGGEDAASETQMEWIGSTFLSMGIGTTKKNVEEAALPFDTRRKGTIVGSAAVAMILEKESEVKKRGLNGQALLLGTCIKNSAYHPSRMNVDHIAGELKVFIEKTEVIYKLNRNEYTESLLFMSHETYTPAKGGSAISEVTALKHVFPKHYRNIIITNTKGLTGHTIGAGIEDAVMIKALQNRKAPAIPNLKEIPADFADLNFSKGKNISCEYGLHFAAGFGSHFSMLFIQRLEEVSVENNIQYKNWLKNISGVDSPKLSIINNTLCILPVKEVRNIDIPVKEKVVAVKGVSEIESDINIYLTIKNIIAEQTGYTVDLLEDKLDLEADLGIDTVKQVEIFGKISSTFNLEVPEDLKLSEYNTIAKLAGYIEKKKQQFSPVIPVKTAITDISSRPEYNIEIKKIIAAQTGYTVDLLEDNLDLEADLGIDTVKQVEIFGKISSTFNLEVPEDLKLSEYNTIAKLTGYIEKKKQHLDPVIPAAAFVDSVISLPEYNHEIKQIIAAQTGYTADLLEDNLDLEADLGIDTVKQVEIFGKISSTFNLEVPEDLKLSEYNTIAKLTGYIEKKKQNLSPEEPAIVLPSEIALNLSEYKKEIRQIIAAQTGYTIDLLEDNLDLEADLGIDTVKQVEIFGKISSTFNLEVPEDLKLSEYNTIAKLTGYIESKKQHSLPNVFDLNHPGHANQTGMFSEGKASTNSTVKSEIKRFIIKVIETALPGHAKNIFNNKTFLLTTDNYGFSDEIKRQIISKNGKIITLGNNKKDDIKIDLGNLSTLENSLSDISDKIQSVDGIIHFKPLDYYFDQDKSVTENSNASVKSFYQLIRSCHNQLNKKGSLLASLSFNSLIFPYENTECRINPSFAGIAGMLKTVKKEMPDTIVKIVDFSVPKLIDNIDEIISQFVFELQGDDHTVETGYKNNIRHILSFEESLPGKGDPFIKKGSTVLVTGGARGITYEILKELVKVYHVNPVIIGKTGIDKVEKGSYGEVLDEKQLFDSLKDEMKNSKPVEIKNAVQQILKAREIHSNLEQLKKIGATVKYEAVDIVDYNSLNKILKKYPLIDGVIHGAGSEESNLITKKDIESFSRLFDIKTQGTYNLLKALNRSNYNFFIAFSSVAAKNGNEGQADYSAGNDMMGKIVMQERNQHPDKIFKIIDWTAWQGTGMADKESVKKVLLEKGIGFLNISQGIDVFKNEILNNDIEVVIASKSTSLEATDISINGGDHSNMRMPFIEKILYKDNHRCDTEYTFSLGKDYYLNDHVFKGSPIVPGSFIAEILIRNGMFLSPYKHFAKLMNYRMHHFIKIFNEKDKLVRVTSRIKKQNNDDLLIDVLIKSDVYNYKNEIIEKDKIHAGCEILFKNSPENILPDISHKNIGERNIQSINIIDAYRPEFLFMGDKMRTLKDITYINDNVSIAVAQYAEGLLHSNIHSSDFILDPIFLDACFQLCAVNVSFFYGMYGTPAAIKELFLFKKINFRDQYYLVSDIKKVDKQNSLFYCDLYIYSMKWELMLYVSEYQGSLLYKTDINILNVLKNSIVKVDKSANVLKPILQ